MAAKADDSKLLKDFAVGNAKFSAEVYKELLKSNSGNFLVCPLSVEIILGLVLAGAGGRTAQQLAAGLHLPQNSEEIQRIFKALTPLLQGNEYYSLTSANKIYIKDGYKIKQQFENVAANIFDAAVQNVDFTKKAVASEINSWVAEKTRNKIKDVIGPNDLDENTCAVLINAMYFNGKWSQPFEKEDTKKKPFFLNNENQVEVDMMEQTGYMKYYDSSELNAKFLEMSYAGARDFISLTFVLPNDKQGLVVLEARIDEVFTAPQFHYHDVHVVVPKFKMESTIQFIPILQALGIEDAFENCADFSLLVDQAVKIDEVIQKAFIEVEEEGTTAAAATVCRTVLCSSLYVPPPPMEFIADHPFIFYIKIKDVVFFTGRYSSATH